MKSLFAIYYDAVRFSHDRRLSAGRPAKVHKLQSRIRMICRRYGEILDDAAPADDAKFVLLQNELVGHTEKLFVFVLHPEVEATNNRSERQARAEAMARKAARTNSIGFPVGRGNQEDRGNRESDSPLSLLPPVQILLR